uniref:Uncharacterized protein n=1 Tax=Medicago truncatula TaxID=3880 RepID=I3SZE3_MEDTR|nr:unknown [Medicago truncatula]
MNFTYFVLHYFNIFTLLSVQFYLNSFEFCFN